MFIALRVTPSPSCQQLVETLAQVREIKADELDNKYGERITANTYRSNFQLERFEKLNH